MHGGCRAEGRAVAPVSGRPELPGPGGAPSAPQVARNGTIPIPWAGHVVASTSPLALTGVPVVEIDLRPGCHSTRRLLLSAHLPDSPLEAIAAASIRTAP